MKLDLKKIKAQVGLAEHAVWQEHTSASMGTTEFHRVLEMLNSTITNLDRKEGNTQLQGEWKYMGSQ